MPDQYIVLLVPPPAHPLCSLFCSAIMTEYDYSEEGYRRYMATQHRIAKWTEDTANCASQFQSPFIPASGARTARTASSYRPLPARRNSHSGTAHTAANFNFGRGGTTYHYSQAPPSSSRHHAPTPPPLITRRSQTHPSPSQSSRYSSSSRPVQQPSPSATSPSRHSSGHSSSHRHHHHRHQSNNSPTYVIETPAPSKHYTNGYVIVPPGYGQVRVVVCR